MLFEHGGLEGRWIPLLFGPPALSLIGFPPKRKGGLLRTGFARKAKCGVDDSEHGRQVVILEAGVFQLQAHVKSRSDIPPLADYKICDQAGDKASNGPVPVARRQRSESRWLNRRAEKGAACFSRSAAVRGRRG